MSTDFHDASHNLRGSAFMLLAMASFAIGDSLMKYVATGLPLSQILVIRGGFAVLILSVVSYAFGHLRPFTAILSVPFLLRLAGEIIATFFFLTALFNMPIANASAIMQALPLTVTVGAAVFLGEALGWRRISAILVGMIGVLMIVQPGLEGFNRFSLFCLVAVFGTTLRDLATRKLPDEVPSFFISLVTTIVIAICGGLWSFTEEWQPVSAYQVGFLATASIFLVSGFVSIVSAMRIGEVGVVTPFRYTVLLFALVIGIVFFDEIPDLLTVLGSIVVVLTGIYTIYRERKISKKATSIHAPK